MHTFFTMEGDDSEFAKFTVPTLEAFLMPKICIFSKQSWSSGQLGNDAKTLFSILHHLFLVILANTTALAFVLLRNSRYNFHCYAQRERTSTQTSTQKWQLWPFATSCVEDHKGHSLVQTSLAELPNTEWFPPSSSSLYSLMSWTLSTRLLSSALTVSLWLSIRPEKQSFMASRCRGMVMLRLAVISLMALLGPTAFRSSSISAQEQNAMQYKSCYCAMLVKVISLMAFYSC